MKDPMQKLLAIARSRKTRIAFNVLSAAIATVVGVLLVQHFRTEGWPLSGAKVYGVIVASVLFLLGYALKALGWRRLFAPGERPGSLALACAGGAASVTGIALPGRFDELVRVAVVRRYPGSCAGVGGVCLSLLLLGLIDSAALAPLAGIAAGIVGTTGLFRAGLIGVAVAGIAAAAVVLLLPKMARADRLSRFRLARWLREHSTSPREASKAWALVSLSWLVRGAALFVLLDALALDASIPLALAFLCASAAAAALPIAPAGAATQAGAGAAMLIASGIGPSQAVAFAIAAQGLAIMMGALILVAAGLWQASLRLRPRPVF
jgi:uncharacterized membrane protein YbhN (UPF0104 family)